MHCSPFPLKKISSNFLGHPVDLSLLLRSLAEIYLARATVAWVPWMLDLSKGCNWYALSFTSICTWNYKNFLQDPKIPSSRIWTSDLWISIVDNYSPPLYQLSYRGWDVLRSVRYLTYQPIMDADADSVQGVLAVAPISAHVYGPYVWPWKAHLHHPCHGNRVGQRSETSSYSTGYKRTGELVLTSMGT